MPVRISIGPYGQITPNPLPLEEGQGEEFLQERTFVSARIISGYHAFFISRYAFIG